MIVADTHAWIWWMSGSRKLSARARRELEAADEVGICAISCWEVAMLAARHHPGPAPDIECCGIVAKGDADIFQEPIHLPLEPGELILGEHVKHRQAAPDIGRSGGDGGRRVAAAGGAGASGYGGLLCQNLAVSKPGRFLAVAPPCCDP